MLIAHLHFLKAYLLTWWDQHFTWHKHIDPETKTPGFLAPHIAVHYFLQHTDFEEMSSNWLTKTEFQDFVGTFPSDAKYRKEKFVDNLFLNEQKIVFTNIFVSGNKASTFDAGWISTACHLPGMLVS